MFDMIKFMMPEENDKSELINFIEYDESLQLENHTILRKFFNILFVPIPNNLPKDFKHKIKKTDRVA
ncbi:MAG: hypothetical protein ACYCZW_01630 [Minisyncoccota bacterium]